MPPDAKPKFNVHKADAKRRGIEFLFTFEEWWSWWQTDDRWSRRGRGRGKLVMARHGDVGPYSAENVRPATHGENIAESAGPRRSESARNWHAERLARGIKPALAVRGAGHPNSRAVVTPAGQFESGALAADHYGITKESIYYRIKVGMPGFSWALELTGAGAAE